MPIQTSKVVYEALWDSIQGNVFEIPVTYTNDSDTTAVFERCGPTHPVYELEKLTSKGWRPNFAVYCDDVARPPITVGPGQELRVMYWFATGSESLPALAFTDRRAGGIYRLAFVARREPSPRPTYLALSNQFRLKVSGRL